MIEILKIFTVDITVGGWEIRGSHEVSQQLTTREKEKAPASESGYESGFVSFKTFTPFDSFRGKTIFRKQ